MLINNFNIIIRWNEYKNIYSFALGYLYILYYASFGMGQMWCCMDSAYNNSLYILGVTLYLCSLFILLLFSFL